MRKYCSMTIAPEVFTAIVINLVSYLVTYAVEGMLVLNIKFDYSNSAIVTDCCLVLGFK